MKKYSESTIESKYHHPPSDWRILYDINFWTRCLTIKISDLTTKTETVNQKFLGQIQWTGEYLSWHQNFYGMKLVTIRPLYGYKLSRHQ